MFGELAVAYLFLGGAGAAGGVVLALLGLGVPCAVRERFLSTQLDAGKTTAYRRFFSCGYAAVLLALAAGAFCLMADAGRADRALLLFASPTLSLMTVGAWALSLSIASAAFMALAWLGLVRISRVAFDVAAIVSVVGNVVVVVYTALLLGTMESVPLWSSGWVLMLFLLSSASCGLALVVGSVQLSGAARAFGTVLARLAAVDAVVIIAELAVLAGFMAVSVGQLAQVASSSAELNALVAGGFDALRRAAAGADAIQLANLASVVLLLQGSNAWLFWVGFAMASALVPLAIEMAMLVKMRAPTSRAVTFSHSLALFVAAFCILAGGFLLRWCIVGAGVQPAALLGA